MKDGWWKRSNTSVAIGMDEEDGGDGDGAPAVSFSSSESSPSPHKTAAVSFAVENDRSTSGGGGSAAIAAMLDTPSPPTSCLRKTPSPPKSTPRETATDSTSEYGPAATKKAKMITTTMMEGEELPSNKQDEACLHHPNDTAIPSPLITTPLTTNINNNSEEDNSDATQIYTVDNIPNSETQLYHDFGDGSFIGGRRRTANCWSSETHTLDQSCAIPSDGPDVSPIAKVGSQSQSQLLEAEVEQEPCLLDGGGGEVEIRRITSSNSSNHDDGSEVDGNIASKELDLDSNSEEGIDPSLPNQPLTTTTTTTTTTKRQPRRDTRKSGCKQNKITTALEAEATPTSTSTNSSSSEVQSQSQSQPLKPSSPNSNAKPPIDNSNDDLTSHAPFVFLLSSPMSLPASDLRCLRRCLKKEKFFMLQNDTTTRAGGLDTHTGDVTTPCSDLDFNFNFELEDDAASFLGTLFQSMTQSKSTSSSPEDEPYKSISSSKSNSNHPPPSFVSTPCCYAICSNSEFQTCDGFIAPRSFQYLLAIACGLPIVDISYIRSAAASINGGGRSNGGNTYLHALETTTMENKPHDAGIGGDTAPPRARTKRTTRGKNDTKPENVGKVPFRIVGDSQSSDWTGPKRARAALLERLSAPVDSDADACTTLHHHHTYNNGLLAGYTVLLCGTYDTLPVVTPTQPRKGGRVKRSRAKSNTNTTAADKLLDEMHHPNLYSRGRLSLLLTLCGAEVLALETFSNDSPSRCMSTSALSSPHREIVILSNGRDRGFCKLARQFAAAVNTDDDDDWRSTVSVVTHGWVLDSIAEFKVRNVEDYGVKTTDD